MFAWLRGRGFRLLMALACACGGVAAASHYTGTYADESGNVLAVSQGSDGVLNGQLTVNGVVYQVSGSAPGDVPGQGLFTSQQGTFSFTVQLSQDANTISFEVREVNAQGQPTGAAPFSVRFTRRSNEGFAGAPATHGFPTAPTVPTTPPVTTPPTPPTQVSPPTIPTAPLSATGLSEIVSGRLGPGDPVLQSGEYGQLHERTLTQGVPVEFVLRSSAFNAYLLILGPDYNLFFEVDDSPNMGTDVRETVVPTVTGTYSIIVTTSRVGEVGAYELAINPAGTSQAPTPSSPLAPPVTSPLGPPPPQTSTLPGLGGAQGLDPTVAARAQDPSQGSIGVIPANTVINGRIAGASGSTYHTYLFEVPAGTQQVAFIMNSDSDLDLFVKLGGDIQDWNEGGDWTQRDVTQANFANIVINAPQAGPWFIDVVFYQGGNATANYTLEVQAR